jgi:hypothetical protein
VHSKTASSIFPGLRLAPPEATRPQKLTIKCHTIFVCHRTINNNLIWVSRRDILYGPEKYARYQDWNVERNLYWGLQSFIVWVGHGRLFIGVWMSTGGVWDITAAYAELCNTVTDCGENCELLAWCCWRWVLLHFGAESLACNQKLVTTADRLWYIC